METIVIDAQPRKVNKTETKHLRHNKNVPCVFYGKESGNIHFSAHENAFKDVVYTSNFHKIQIKLDGKEYNGILKEAQFDPVTDKLIHLDFVELVPGRKMIAEIPLKFIGTAQGVKDGGVLMPKKRSLKVKVLPENLIDFIEINVEPLKLGKSIKIGDIKSSTLEFLDTDRITVVNIEVPRALKSAEDTAAETATAEGAAPTAEGAAAKPAEGGAAKPGEAAAKQAPAKAEAKK